MRLEVGSRRVNFNSRRLRGERVATLLSPRSRKERKGHAEKTCEAGHDWFASVRLTSIGSPLNSASSSLSAEKILSLTLSINSPTFAFE
jgi:hypothetical protein